MTKQLLAVVVEQGQPAISAFIRNLGAHDISAFARRVRLLVLGTIPLSILFLNLSVVAFLRRSAVPHGTLANSQHRRSRNDAHLRFIRSRRDFLRLKINQCLSLQWCEFTASLLNGQTGTFRGGFKRRVLAVFFKPLRSFDGFLRNFSFFDRSFRGFVQFKDLHLGFTERPQRNAVVFCHANRANDNYRVRHLFQLFALFRRQRVPQRQLDRAGTLVAQRQLSLLNLRVVRLSLHRAQVGDGLDNRAHVARRSFRVDSFRQVADRHKLKSLFENLFRGAFQLLLLARLYDFRLAVQRHLVVVVHRGILSIRRSQRSFGNVIQLANFQNVLVSFHGFSPQRRLNRRPFAIDQFHGQNLPFAFGVAVRPRVSLHRQLGFYRPLWLIRVQTRNRLRSSRIHHARNCLPTTGRTRRFKLRARVFIHERKLPDQRFAVFKNHVGEFHHRAGFHHFVVLLREQVFRERALQLVRAVVEYATIY